MSRDLAIGGDVSAVVFFAVIGAAFLHASWNALVKVGNEQYGAMLVLTGVQGALGLLVALSLPLPPLNIWPWLIASGVFHAGYKLFLIYAYEHGDLSRVYPIARGAAPLIVLAVGAIVLADVLTSQEVLAILVLGLGIILMARSALRAKENRKLIPFALGSAAMTAGYSLVDGMGARALGDAVTYVAWLFIMDFAFMVPITALTRGTRGIPRQRRTWLFGSVGGALSYGAYAVVVWAMTQAPIALVTALRETSIFFAVLIGWLVFGEAMTRSKALAAVLIVSGVILSRL